MSLSPTELTQLLDIAYRMDTEDELRVTAMERRQVGHALRRIADSSPADHVQRRQEAGDIATPADATSYYAGWAEAIEDALTVADALDTHHPSPRDFAVTKESSHRPGHPARSDPVTPGSDAELLHSKVVELLKLRSAPSESGDH